MMNPEQQFVISILSSLLTFVAVIITATVAMISARTAATAAKEAARAAQISERSDDKITNLAITIDGRMGELLQRTSEAANAAGRAEGIAAETIANLQREQKDAPTTPS